MTYFLPCSLKIKIIDLKCSMLGRLIPYDGSFNPIFSSDKEDQFTREFLDSWLSDVCSTGRTFHEAFYSLCPKIL